MKHVLEKSVRASILMYVILVKTSKKIRQSSVNIVAKGIVRIVVAIMFAMSVGNFQN